MGMFTMRKPRGFNHPYIYADERKEKLAKKAPNVNWECCLRRSFRRKISGESS